MAELTIKKTVTVDVPIEKAFEVFTERFDTWWPRTHKTGAAELKQAVLEGRQGGRWYEIGVDGSECEWGRVLHWDPPNRLVLAWQLDSTWHFDPGLVTEVEVRFSSEGANKTRVDLEHRNLDRFGDAQDEVRTAMDSSDMGWTTLLRAFKEAAAT